MVLVLPRHTTQYCVTRRLRGSGCGRIFHAPFWPTTFDAVESQQAIIISSKSARLFFRWLLVSAPVVAENSVVEMIINRE